MRRWLSFAALVVAFALGSRLGWWAVPVVAALWGLMRPRINAPAGTAALAAVAAWAWWLIYDWLRNSAAFGRLAGRMAGVVGVPSAGLIVLTLLLAALLAWSAAVLAQALAASLASRSGDSK